VTDAAMPRWMRDVVAALPGIQAHQLVDHRPPGGTAPRAASVLVLFGQGDRGPELLLLERAAEMWLSVTDFLVTPVIGWWRERGRVHAVDPAETASVHVVAVDDLLDPAHRGRVRHPSGYVGPAFRVGEVLVWGFTALVLSGLFRELRWERPWNPEQYFELPDGLRTPAAGDPARRRTAAGVETRRA
jgi:hypothetical protein